MKKYVAVGEAFESLEVAAEVTKETGSDHQIDARTKDRESRTRANLAYVTVGGSALAIAVAAGLGMYDGSFDELQSIWSIVAPFVGGYIFGHYFGGTGANGSGGEKN